MNLDDERDADYDACAARFDDAELASERALQLGAGAKFLNGDRLHASVFNWREPLAIVSKGPYGYLVVDAYCRRGLAT